MLKTTRLFDEPVPNRNNSSKLAFKKIIGDGKINKYGNNNIEYAKKLGKSKVQKLFQFQKLFKSKKKLSKNKNLANLDAKKTGSSFLTSGATEIFNCLWLVFTNILIF